MKDCKNCTEKEALFQFAIEKANECENLKAELSKAKDAICEAVYRSAGKGCADGEKDGSLFFWKGRAEQLADQLREKDMELAQKDAHIRELQGIIEELQRVGKEQPNDLYSASRRFFEALFSYADGNENGADA